MYRATAFIAGTVLTLSAGTLHAGDPVAGQEKSQACIACHGETGVGDVAEYPILAGQYESYLLYSMQQYQSGERENAIMQAQMADLSEQDLRDLAAFYARQDDGVFVPSIDRRARITD